MPPNWRHLLVISRDQDLLESLTVPFTAAHYALHTFPHANTPSIDVFAHNVDALIVDLEPDLGPETCHRLAHLLRAARVPCLAVTAQNRANQRIVALEAGAQAVLSRPVQVPELVARLNVLVPAAGPTRALGAQFIGPHVMLDTVASTLACPDFVIALTTQEIALLSLLGQSVNHVVSHGLLCDRLGVSCDQLGCAVVRQAVTRLRRKLGGDSPGALRLVTERQHGYRLVFHENHAWPVSEALAGPQAGVMSLGLSSPLQAALLLDRITSERTREKARRQASII